MDVQWPRSSPEECDQNKTLRKMENQQFCFWILGLSMGRPSEKYINNIFSEYISYVVWFGNGRDRNTEYTNSPSLPFTAYVFCHRSKLLP
jgi:hypothetical protein